MESDAAGNAIDLEPKEEATDFGLGPGRYHFYRCDSCHSILTRDDELRSEKTGQICECGSGKYRPTNPFDREFDNDAKVKAYMAAHDLQPIYARDALGIA